MSTTRCSLIYIVILTSTVSTTSVFSRGFASSTSFLITSTSSASSWLDARGWDFVRVSLEQSSLQLLLLLIFHSVSTLDAQVEDRDAIVDHSVLDFVIERAVSLEGRHLIHLDQGRFELMIKHDVEAENLEALTVLNVVWLARAEQMMHMRLRQTHRLHNDLIDLIEDPVLGHEAVVARYLLEDKLVGALTPHIISILVLVLHEVARLLIDGVVGQMHAQVVQVGGGRALVLNSGETGKAIFVDIDS